MIKRMLMVLLVVAAMAGCSSTPLDQPPVEDKSASAVTPGTGPGTGTNPNADTRGVAPVDLSGTNTTAAGPQGVARIVYFDYDSYVIKPEFQSLIEAHARFLKGSNARRVAIEGHTDERGGREYNLALGQRRAEAVRRAFGLLGVADSQVEAVSFGKEKPAVPGSDESAYSQNRRAEIAYR